MPAPRHRHERCRPSTVPAPDARDGAADDRRRPTTAAARVDDHDHRHDAASATPGQFIGRGPSSLPQVDLLSDAPMFGAIRRVGDLVFTAGGDEFLAPPDIPIGIVRNVIQPLVGGGHRCSRSSCRPTSTGCTSSTSSSTAPRRRPGRPARSVRWREATDVRLARPGPAAAAVLRRRRAARPAAHAVRRPPPGRRSASR